MEKNGWAILNAVDQYLRVSKHLSMPTESWSSKE
jgi:hypothetical protein